jgi:quercetin dioxygenase-like cupin family protein
VIFSLHEYPDGVRPLPGRRVVYELATGEARFGAARADGHALVWELSEYGGAGAKLAVEIDRDRSGTWVLRCDRVDFPPGAVAYRHVHPGPGIRRLLHGELTIEADDHTRAYGAGGAWFEGADYPVRAIASADEETAFVRTMLLPAQWAGKRTVRYLDPTDDEKPKLQRATVLLEEPVAL